MRPRTLLIVATALLTLGIIGSAQGGLGAQAPPPAALSGVVSSQAEGPMEGVVVNARRDGANFTVSVVSDAQGKYTFPRSHLDPGKYTITIRAAGYDLVNPGPAEVKAGKTASADLKVEKTRDLASQLSSLEWAMSIPGTTEQKDTLVYQTVNCAYCHNWQRVMKSKHTADEFVSVMNRMQMYYTDGTAVSNDGRGRGQKQTAERVAAVEKNANWGSVPKKDLADYLATLNLSGGRTTWPFELKTLPRPTGKATRVIITQYDMPRPDTVSHDLDLDSKGTVWYTDESRMFFGKMDPKTGKFTEWPLPAVPAGDIPGTRDIQVDKDDNIWFPRRVTGPAGAGIAMTRFNPKTEQVSTIEGVGGQFLAMGPDGKIWAGLKRIDPKTMQVDGTYTWQDSPNLPPGPPAGMYVDLTIVDSKGNPWFPDFRGSHIVGIDAVTKVARFWPVPTPNSSPRRSRMDAQDRFWFAEYTGDKIGMFDTRTEKFQEWTTLPKYTTPYAVSAPDRNGYVYATSNTAERLIRLDPRTGEMIAYQIPTDFDSKKIAHDPTTNRSTLWMVNTRNARIMKVEPLD